MAFLLSYLSPNNTNGAVTALCDLLSSTNKEHRFGVDWDEQIVPVALLAHVFDISSDIVLGELVCGSRYGMRAEMLVFLVTEWTKTKVLQYIASVMIIVRDDVNKGITIYYIRNDYC